MFQLVFNLVWALPLDTDQKSYEFFLSVMKANIAPPESTTF